MVLVLVNGLGSDGTPTNELARKYWLHNVQLIAGEYRRNMPTLIEFGKRKLGLKTRFVSLAPLRLLDNRLCVLLLSIVVAPVIAEGVHHDLVPDLSRARRYYVIFDW